MGLYYFYDPVDDNQYLTAGEEDVTPDQTKAGHFTEQDWQDWGRKRGCKRIPVPDDVIMRKIGAPTLPGFE